MAMDCDGDTTQSIVQKIQSLLLSRCGYDQHKVKQDAKLNVIDSTQEQKHPNIIGSDINLN